ncbi:hypothetical protein Patl1_12352 [Pistacia atlantica]|uniref:Uncharacterized protein n=1 Tax=Pistacia atlantica TaxID=434234 RepID=A0ACC1A4F1_9ROSI|nr:hypothetical protein Patl1_12352 [Pistacia atlantica]
MLFKADIKDTSDTIRTPYSDWGKLQLKEREKQKRNEMPWRDQVKDREKHRRKGLGWGDRVKELTSDIISLSLSISAMMEVFCATMFIVFKGGMLWIPIPVMEFTLQILLLKSLFKGWKKLDVPNH